MNTKLQNINLAIGKLLATLKRFPLSMFFAYLFTITVMLLTTLNYQEKMALTHYDIINKISFIAGLGFFLFTTLRLISRNLLLLLLGIIILIAYFIYLPNDIQNLPQLEIEFPLIIFSLLSLMIVAPYMTQSTSNIKFWSWAKHIILSLLLSIIFGFILFAGLSGGLYITENLFALEQTNQYPKYIFLFTLGIFTSYFFLSQLPKYPRLFQVKAYNSMENIFTKFILTPLFILYFIILYTYTTKIIFLGEWPKGTVSLSILLFSALSILTYLFWTPLWDKKSQKYKNFFWWAILIQTFVLAIALYLRVEPYGWTNGRYMIGIMGFWLFAISLYFILNKKASYRIIFISLPLLLMLSLFSPFSANTIAQLSQQERLKTLLAQVEMMEENLSEESNLSLRYNISSSISYLHDRHGIESLFPLLPEIVTTYENRELNITNNCTPVVDGNFPNYATKQLGFNYIDRWQWEQHTQALDIKRFKTVETPKSFMRLRDYEQGNQTKIKGYDWLLSFNYAREESNYPRYCPPPHEQQVVSKRPYSIETTPQTIMVKEKNNLLATINIKKFIYKVTTTKKEDDTSLHNYYDPITFTEQEFTHYFNNNKITIKLVFDNIELSSKDELIHYTGKILIGKK